MGILAQPKQTVNEDSLSGSSGIDYRLELERVAQAEKVLRIGRTEPLTKKKAGLCRPVHAHKHSRKGYWLPPGVKPLPAGTAGIMGGYQPMPGQR